MNKLRDRMGRVLAVSAVALLAVALLTGCKKHETLPRPEGLPVELNGLNYTVYITRQLNLRDPEDHDYYQGPEAPPGFSYYGVFIQVCNAHDNAPFRVPVNNFTILDTQGNVYRPTSLPATNIWAYRPRALGSNQCIPVPGSAAAGGPTGGSLLLFKLPIPAIENRPMDLEIAPPLTGTSPKKLTHRAGHLAPRSDAQLGCAACAPSRRSQASLASGCESAASASAGRPRTSRCCAICASSAGAGWLPTSSRTRSRRPTCCRAPPPPSSRSSAPGGCAGGWARSSAASASSCPA